MAAFLDAEQVFAFISNPGKFMIARKIDLDTAVRDMLQVRWRLRG